MPDVLMPRLSDSMQEGTILRWLKRPGEAVRKGDGLAEIETDKATVMYEADADGVLEIVAREGQTLTIGAVIARLGSEAPAPADSPNGVAVEQPAASTSGAKGDVTVVELSRAQQVVVRRTAESKATVPDFTLTTEVDMARCIDLRAQLQELEPDAVPSLGELVVKASAIALRAFPRANGGYRDGRLELYSRVNVGVAVAVEDGLVVPTVFDADRKPVHTIARELRALEEKARAGTLTPPELGGGTFTVTDLGVYGATGVTAIINPPQAAALAVGAVTPRPVVRDGEVVVRPIMALTLACDHRILYGAGAAGFLAGIREALERPASMLL